MYQYKVSFGPKSNLVSVHFCGYKNALKFLNECIDAGRVNVIMEQYLVDVVDEKKCVDEKRCKDV